MKNSFLLILLFALSTSLVSASGLAQGNAKNPPKKDHKVDYVLVKKSRHLMYLVKENKILHRYQIALGANPIGHKIQEGDERTPEGRYVISEKHEFSRFYKSLLISYPNPEDIKNARKRGVNPGGNIMIHGIPNDFVNLPDFLQDLQNWLNWTDGCIAVTNKEMDQIFTLVHVGIPIVIQP